MNKQALEFIKSHEGFSAKPYLDTANIETIGYGRNLSAYPLSEDEQREILINEGRYSKEDAQEWLINQLQKLENELNKYHWFKKLDTYRQAIVLDMAYNLGVPRLLLFKKMILALNSGDYASASREMLNSGWAMQVKSRASKLAIAMREIKQNDEVNA
ncbi:glycoside hydrolase family protein [Helicobacter sp. 13S00477-4]|uniref:glycoside hydrolase family protein n=1 Tax=Helicobacter sp. 13S00477-4 TaxID=1905759 RepID=UPI000BA64D1C|nr:glycoside hydrolase family protein [Helicobacter sp. 13S00477-4]PAF50855.1 hypothetical protein BKH44_06820 [Helicobacter sp. 13S00477-4]